MKANFKNYKNNEDFIKIRDFLVSTYKETKTLNNWLIDRWNFTYSMSRIMNSVTIHEWEERIGIWEKEGEIIGVVNSEGENNGEAFFQLSNNNISDSILEEMFDFTENKLWIENDGKKYIQLRIPLEDSQREAIAIKRGYKKAEYSETTSVMSIEDIKDMKLPEGFTIKSGTDVSDVEKGLAHAKAFGYVETEFVKVSPKGYEAMRQMPNYRPDLDLYVVVDSGEIASFCTMCYDDTNKIGILEPVGTIPNFRRMGLGHAVIYEAVKRIEKEGALKVYVGSGQDFYGAIGFERKYKSNIWVKTI